MHPELFLNLFDTFLRREGKHAAIAGRCAHFEHHLDAVLEHYDLLNNRLNELSYTQGSYAPPDLPFDARKPCPYGLRVVNVTPPLPVIVGL